MSLYNVLEIEPNASESEIKKLDNEAELAEINNKTLKKQIIKEEKTKLKSEKIAAHLKKQTQETAELEHQKKLKSAKQTIQKSEENKIISKAQALALEEKQKLKDALNQPPETNFTPDVIQDIDNNKKEMLTKWVESQRKERLTKNDPVEFRSMVVPEKKLDDNIQDNQV